MPTYSYECECGRLFDRVLPLSQYSTPQACPCGGPSRKVITAPDLIVKPDIRYTSPIDGRPITSPKARADDLARSGCIPYDPGMKQDYQRRIKENEAALERSVDETVERTISAMPSAKREKLQAELDSGLTAQPIRGTAPKQAISKRIRHA